MRINQAAAILEQSDLPAFLWGSPGIGKSAIVKQIAERKQIECIDLRLTLLDPTDLRGLPVLKGDSAVWIPPAFLPKEGQGILFLDELNAAPPAIQASAYQLVLDRRVGEYVLPAGWSIVAAGNRDSDMAITFRMPTPLRNRFLHLDIEPHIEDWKEWALHNGIDPVIIGFLNFRPGLLSTFGADFSAQAFATPRTWEYASNLLAFNLEEVELRLALGGVIGQETAAEFWAFRELSKTLPSVDEILGGKDIVPENPSILYALCGSLAGRAHENITRVLRYSLLLPAEFAVLLIKDIHKNNHCDIFSSPAWQEWSETYNEIVL
jgi:hypothetical protein